MRYITPVYFQKITPGALDPQTHNYGVNSVKECKVYASITDSGKDTLRLVYGGIKQGSLTVRLQRPYKTPFDSMRIDDKTYNVDFSRGNKVFVVSEVQ